MAVALAAFRLSIHSPRGHIRPLRTDTSSTAERLVERAWMWFGRPGRRG
jgi:hypothetical protein